jgi:hypothetical protein
MEPLQRAREWYTRALHEEDTFIRFVLLYISLEIFSTDSGSNVRTFLQNNSNFIKFLEITDIEKLKIELDKKPHLNMNPDGDKRWNGILIDTNDWKGLIEYLVRSRNNLFHGDKGFESERDNLIVTLGNSFLEPILKNLVAER